MKKIASLFLSTLLLTACTSTTEPNEATQPTNVKTDFGQQPAPTPVENENTLTEEEAFAIATQTIKQLTLAACPEQVGDYILDHSNYVFNEGEIEEILVLKNELVRPYATQSFIDTNIPLDEFNCTENCEIILPNDLYYAWKPVVENVTDTHFQVIAFVTEFDINVEDFNSFEQTIDFVLEGGTWKMNQLTRVQKDINLQVDEIKAYMKANGFNDITINTTDEWFHYNGRDELVYNVTDNEGGNVLLLFARNGNYSYTQAQGEPLEEGDYSIDNEYDYLSYTLFDYYRSVLHRINMNNPSMSDAVYELDNLTGGIATAMDADDIEQLQSYVTEASTLYDTLYNEFGKNLSANEQIYFEASQETFNEELKRFITVYLADGTPAERLGYEALAITYNSYVLLSELSN